MKITKKQKLITIFILALFGTGNASASLIFGNDGTNTTLSITENIEFTATGASDIGTMFVFEDVYSVAPNVITLGTISNTIGVLINGAPYGGALNTTDLFGPVDGLNVFGEIDLNDFTITFLNEFSLVAGDVLTLTPGIAVTNVSAASMPDLAASTAIMTDITGTAISNITNVAVVPVPAAVWLFASGLISLIGFARRKIV